MKKGDCMVFPKILLHFDLNGTLILQDTSKQVNPDYMIISALAEDTFAKWSDNTEEMSFKDYVYQVLKPGDKSDPLLKKERQAIIADFFNWIQEDSNAYEKYRQVKEKYLGSLKLFDSFYKLLEKMREMNLQFTVILRTFGNDLTEVVEEMSKHPSGIKISHFGKFDKCRLSIDGQTIENMEKTFLNSAGHFAIQDDWSTWNADGERGRSGKPFILDRENTTCLSLFFDDNITGLDQDIIKTNVPIIDLIGVQVFPVRTMQAMLDDNYYIDCVLKSIRKWEVNGSVTSFL